MGITAINVRNQFKGKVKEIIRGPVVSEVDVDTPFGIVTSVITTRSVDELELKVGADVVEALNAASTARQAAYFASASEAGLLCNIRSAFGGVEGRFTGMLSGLYARAPAALGALGDTGGFTIEAASPGWVAWA
jgi:molybdopterin-binding protein